MGVKDDRTQPSWEAVMAVAGQGDNKGTVSKAGDSELPRGSPEAEWGSERGSVSDMAL